jgi:hypothetical protein
LPGISSTIGKAVENRKERHEPHGDRNGHRRTKNRDRGRTTTEAAMPVST